MKKLTEQQKIRRQILFNMPHTLLNFLIKEKVLKSFLDNTSLYTLSRNLNLKCVFLKLRDSGQAIECTFIWRHSSEGHSYWYNLNEKYKWEMSDSGALLLLSDC
jgi:hypothetical protein